VSSDGNLRPIFREHLRVGFDWTSVETGSTILGVPDSNYCALVKEQHLLVRSIEHVSDGPESPLITRHTGVEGTRERGVEGWVEFKQTSGWACTLRPEQVGWHLRRQAHGGRSFVATRRWHDGHSRSDAVDELWIHHGSLVRELKVGGLRAAAPLGRWSDGPVAWNWDEVRRILCC